MNDDVIRKRHSAPGCARARSLYVFLIVLGASSLHGCWQTAPLQQRPVSFNGTVCATPVIPLAALVTEMEAATIVEFTITPEGLVTDAVVIKPSGSSATHRQLDRLALRAAESCQFAPAPGFLPARARREYAWSVS